MSNTPRVGFNWSCPPDRWEKFQSDHQANRSTLNGLVDACKAALPSAEAQRDLDKIVQLSADLGIFRFVSAQVRGGQSD